jgi:hypothetical protein
MHKLTQAHWLAFIKTLWIGVPCGLVVTRLAYELNPFQFSVLGDPAIVLGAAVIGTLLWAVLLWGLAKFNPAFPVGPTVFIAGILWLHILAAPSDIQPLRGELLLGTVVGFVGLTWLLTRWKGVLTRTEIGALAIGLLAMLIYIQALQPVVGKADTFEFQLDAVILGIPHPTGYPLFTLLGKVFSLLPFGSMAARVNLTSTAAAVFAVGCLYFLLRQTLGLRTGAAALAALWFAFSPVMFSQSVEAEVYTLDVAFAVPLMLLAFRMVMTPPEDRRCPLVLMAALMGFNLTNHITSVTLIPPLVIAFLIARPRCSLRQIGWAALAFFGALCLYCYLPIRWNALNSPPMSLSEFVAWVTAARFKGALQLGGWLHDPERWNILFRILQDQFGSLGLVLAGFGFFSLLRRNWAVALITAVAFAGEFFFCINYYVPDLDVFMIPLFLYCALWIAVALHTLVGLLEAMLRSRPTVARYATLVTYTAIAVLILVDLSTILPEYTWSSEKALIDWGNYTLSLPLAPKAVILADSQKIAPLDYLHEAEGRRPDIDVSVLATEQAYREALSQYTALGRPVYLARQLPGLEGGYHLRSLGDLIEVGQTPLLTVPDALLGQAQRWPNGITLLGYRLDAPVVQRGDFAHLTLYWQSQTHIDDNLDIQLRLVQGDTVWKSLPTAPVEGWYPTNAWKPPEIVPDYHAIAVEQRFLDGQYTLQVRLTHPFERDPLMLAAGQDWVTLGPLQVQGTLETPPFNGQRAAIAFPGGGITAINLPDFTSAENAQGELRVTDPAGTTLRVIDAGTSTQPVVGKLLASTTALAENSLQWSLSHDVMRCGWLLPQTDTCPLGTTTRSNMPANTIANFENKIALTDVQFQTGQIVPGGTLAVTLEWHPLQKLDQDYTVFIHFLGPDGRVHGQVDQFPVQGTYPTSAWKPGETIVDHYNVLVGSDAPPGNYRLEIGFYLLSTGQRLLLYDAQGTPTSDVLLENGLFLK